MTRIKDNPTVSVVIPTYNRAYIVGRAIQSVLNQTYQDFEIIIVDDGSTDNTEEVVKGFADGRIRYIQHEENRGEATARNLGIKVAQGEYIAVDDDDTEWLPEKLEKQIKAFEEASPKVGVVYTAMWEIIENKKIYLPPPDVMQKEGNIHKELLRDCFVWNPVVLVKKECFDRAGMFDEKLPGWLEWDMALRISKYYDFRYIDEPLVILYYSPATSHYSQTGASKRWILFLEKHFQEFKENDKRSLAKRYFDIGIALYTSDDLTQFAERRTCLYKAVKICPLNFKYILFSFISLFGPALFYNRPLRKLYIQFKRILRRV